jgi:branched-chain amino acid transport system substrate-binding protein
MKRTVFLIIALLALLFTVFWLINVERFSKSTATRTRITIGHIATLTGETAIYGEWEKEGIEFALSELSAVKSFPEIEIIHEDDQGEPKRAVSAMQKLISANHCRAVIGCTLSSTTLACAPIANENKVVLLSPSAQSPKISEAGPFVFRIFVSSSIEGPRLAELTGKLGIKTASLLCIKNDYGFGLKNVLSASLPKQDIRIVSVNEYLPDQTDFSTLVTKATETNPEALILLGYPNDMGRAIKQARQIGFAGKILAPASYETREVNAIAGTAADGVFYVYPVLPNDPKPLELARRFRDKFRKEMNVYNAVAYDAVMLFEKAIQAAANSGRATTGEAIRHALESTTLPEGAGGPIAFDGRGDAVDRPMEARIAKGPGYEVFKP